ncbi:hypothetical protein [Streptomyces sp. NPDC088350]|uniref:hypothetical protein n=1 Tax=Streptomyces sp. NPDC088350 TaxID=3365854 RepID=UPI0038034A4D
MGRGMFVLPGAAIENDREAERAASHAMSGVEYGMAIRRQVGIDVTQMRRRKVIVHLFATELLTRAEVALLRPLDPRAVPSVLPVPSCLTDLPERALGRVALGLIAFQTGLFVRLEGGVLRAFEPPAASCSRKPA